MIHYLMYVDTHGAIIQIKLAKGFNPADREIDPVQGQYCVHYMEALEDVGGFHMLKAWNYELQEWADRPRSPNPHASWREGAWTWDPELLLRDIRNARNALLFRTDWAMVSDAPLTETQKEEVISYRTSLRELPTGVSAETNSVDTAPWPTKPSFL